jgi:serine/threonine protein kinase
MNCEFTKINGDLCKHKHTKELNGMKYCTGHYNINIKEEKTKEETKEETKEKKIKKQTKISKNNLHKIIDILDELNIKYSSIEFINKGTFLYVYKINIDNNLYAIKVQFLDNKVKNVLYYEYLLLMDHLNASDNIVKLIDISVIKKIYYNKPNKFAILITELLDETLSEKKNKHIFSIEEVKSIGIKLIEVIEYIHSNKFLYIDLKPDNIMFDSKNNLKLVDFNACSKYLNYQSEFYENKLIKNPIGNFIYSSVNLNKSYSGIRIDDIESILWIMLYLLDKDIITDIINQKSVTKLIDIKEKYILNYLLGRDKFIFNFIEELKTYDTINNKKPNYRKFINILQND